MKKASIPTGPWRVIAERDMSDTETGQYGISNGFIWIASVMPHACDSIEQRRAVAEAIAEVPEMVEALRWLADSADDCPALDNARAILARIDGEAE